MDCAGLDEETVAIANRKRTSSYLSIKSEDIYASTNGNMNQSMDSFGESSTNDGVNCLRSVPIVVNFSDPRSFEPSYSSSDESMEEEMLPKCHKQCHMRRDSRTEISSKREGIKEMGRSGERTNLRAMDYNRYGTHTGSISDIEDPEDILDAIVSKERVTVRSNGINRISSMDHTAVDSVFSSVRSISTADIEADLNESELYAKHGPFHRAFPDRFYALLVTMLFELPVVFMVNGNSNRLCNLIGRQKFHLLLAFLPLTSAISGNCGLQGSSLTTRAISHTHVSKNSYSKWFRIEIEAALYLGLSMALVLGSFAFVASNYDHAFGLTIAIAQFVSVVTAGFTGTLAPLVFSFVFRRDAGKWAGPLETAVQDIVGSFTMMVLSFHLISIFGPAPIPRSDVCNSEL